MSFNTLIRAYMDKAQAATPEQNPVDRPSWLRKLAGSAAVGLSLGLLSFGCGGNDPAEETPTGDDEAGKEDSLKSKKCYSNHDCSAGKFCKKTYGPVVTPKYGIYPAQTSPAPTPKYGIIPSYGKCAPLAECYSDADCATGQHCEGAVADSGSTGSSCPKGAYCILPPTPPSTCPEGAYCILPPTPTPQPGICTIDCSTTKDCPKNEICVGATSGSTCPVGAYCILPPTPPKKGSCQMQFYPLYGVQVPTK